MFRAGAQRTGDRERGGEVSGGDTFPVRSADTPVMLRGKVGSAALGHQLVQ